MRSVLILIILSFFNFSYSQESNQKEASVSGYVFEYGSGIALEGVTLKLLSVNDSSLAGGAQTDSEGFFRIDEVGFGTYEISASMVGHNIVTMKGIKITRKNPELTADTIFLKPGETTTDEIDVTAERSLVEFKADKKVYNVENSILDKGGNASDLLRKIPSVSVDQDGNVSLRGSANVKFMIDGKMVRQNTTSILEQTPAGSIESIEIISNPGSKYEAEGEAGLINIVLKKGNELSGYAGQFSLGAGNSDKYNGGLSLSKKNSKINIYGNYNYRDFDMKFDGGSSLTNYFANDPKYINESVNSLMKNISHSLKAGTDFYLSPKTTLGLSATYLFRDRNSTEKTETENINSSNINTLNEITNSAESEKGNAFETTLSLNKVFDSPLNTLTGEATIAFNNEDEDLSFNTQDFDAQMNPLNNTPLIKNSLTSENNLSGSFQLDYVHPFFSNKDMINDKGKEQRKTGKGNRDEARGKNNKSPSRIETGIKAVFSGLESRINGETFDYTANTFVNDSDVTNNFDYDQNIIGGYGIYGSNFGDLSFMAGARAEMTFTKVDQNLGDTVIDKNYIDIFPSLSFAYDLSMTDKLQADYSRRISRPDGRQLVPFVDNSNPTNIRVGNPELGPEYINSFQMSYLKFFKGFTINPSVYYRHTTDAISRFRTQLDSVTTLTTFENLDKSDAVGVELIAGYQGSNNLSINGSINYSYNKLYGQSIDPGLDNSGSSFSAKLNAGIKIWYDFDLQISYNFQGRRPMITGDMEPFSTFEAGIKKDLFDDALSIGLRFSDIFNKQKFDVNFSNSTFEQDFYRKRESRYAFLTLTYNFGVKEVKQKKRREREENRPPDSEF